MKLAIAQLETSLEAENRAIRSQYEKAAESRYQNEFWLKCADETQRRINQLEAAIAALKAQTND